MRDSRGSYVRRGDVERRVRRIKHQIVGVSVCAVLLVAYQSNGPTEASASPAPPAPAPDSMLITRALERELVRTRAELAATHQHLERSHKVFGFSTRYGISAELAASIYDIATAEGIEPDLAFRVVKHESRFKVRATSPVGAVGLTQVMVPTARYFQPNITREKLYDRDTNLRIGFRYLRTLIDENDGNVRLALLTYNRGPRAVQLALRNGKDPSNGYDRIVMRGYQGSGVVNRRATAGD